MKKTKPFLDPNVAARFSLYPKKIIDRLLTLRELIFSIAAEHEEVGELYETLKWGEPSYLTKESKSGTTIRIDWKKSRPNHYALYVNCKSSLIQTFKQLYPEDFVYEGNRSILFHEDETIDIKKLSHCILLALTYHRNKKQLK